MAAPSPTDDRRHSAAAERNREPILVQWRRLLPAGGTALEIAAGTGQHAAHFAAALPGWTWLPTDPAPEALASIAAWCAGLPNVRPPRRLDVHDAAWHGVPDAVDAMYVANLLHIAPWSACAALMAGAARHLRRGGRLVVYGPFVEADLPTAPSNLAFDADLRARDPAWGLRALDDVDAQACRAGLRRRERVAMPANNLLLVYEPNPGVPR